jgi:hypothetical protein
MDNKVKASEQSRQLRQGDVLLVPVERLPSGKKKARKNGILAYGEATGHSHSVADLLAAEVYEIENGMYLSVTAEDGVSIVHQEHGPILVPKGKYQIRIQREYSPEEIRNVKD